MSTFKKYKSKPIVRNAYQLTEDSDFTDIQYKDRYALCLGKEEYIFFSAEVPEVGGWVVFLDEDDLYYCSDKVFRERNYV